MFYVKILTFALLLLTVCYADVKLQELKSDDLLLLNVAVKARLLERLSEETDKLQYERNKLVANHKTCLLNVSANAKACQECVVQKCVNRGLQCKLSERKLQMIKDVLNVNDIPGVDFLSTPKVVQEEIREIKETAETDIMKDVPKNLEPKGKAIMEKIKEGMAVFHDNLGRAVNELPVLLPKLEKNIENLGSNIDMDAVDDIANRAADQISQTVNDPMVQGISVHVINGKNVLKENLPSFMNTMKSALSHLTSAVGRFVGVVRVQAGTAWKQATIDVSNRTNTVSQTQMAGANIVMMPQPFIPQQRPNGEVAQFGPHIHDQPQIQPPIQFPQQALNNQQFSQQLHNMAGNHGFPQQFVAPEEIWRNKRQAEIPCDFISAKLFDACHSYHFYCAPCMNEKTILEHDCGPKALVAMVAIKELDLEAGRDIIKYKKFINSGKIIQKVYYDPTSIIIEQGTYSRAYITVHIGEEDRVFGTSVLPDISNLKHAGFVLGDELWNILQEGGEPNKHNFLQTNVFHTVNPEYLRSDPSSESSAVIQTAMWGALALVMYLGYVAISVMV